MKHYLALTLFIYSISLMQAQDTHWEWARGANGIRQEGIAVGVDPVDGTVVAGGYYRDTVEFSGIILSCGVGEESYIVKYDSTGNVLWADNLGRDAGIVSSISVDLQGNIDVLGYFVGASLILGTDTLGNSSPSSLYDIFLARFDKSGNLQWARTGAGTFYTFYPGGVSCDAKGRIWITGYYVGSAATIGAFSLPASLVQNVQAQNYFIAVYDSSGNVLQAQTPSDQNNSSGMSVSSNLFDPQRAVYATGSFSGDSLKLGNIVLYNSDASSQSASVFLAKYDSTGKVVWARNSTGNTYVPGWSDFPTAISAYKDGSVYVAGAFAGPLIVFGTDSLVYEDQAQKVNVFIAKYNAAGEVKWGKIGKRTDFAQAEGVAVDTFGNLYVTISLTDSSLVDTLLIDTSTFIPPGNATDPLLVLKCDTNGNILFGTVLGCGGDDGSGLAADNFGDVYLCDDYTPAPNFIIGPDTLTNSGGETFFLGKLVSGTRPTGTINITDERRIVIFPNPSTGTWQLTTSNEFIGSAIEVYNTTGQLIFQAQIKNTISQIALPNISSGIYELRIISPRGIFVRRIVKL